MKLILITLILSVQCVCISCINIFIPVASYRPTLPVTHAMSSLGFEAEQDLVAWLTEKKITLAADDTKIDCKASMAALSSI